jgi:AcrR family transcriptional regulator
MATPSTPNRASETRRRILEAAAHCLTKHGFDHVRMDEVAEVAGVSRALVHRYFGDKTALLQHVRARVLDEWSATLDRAIAAAPDAGAAIGVWLDLSLDHAARQPLLPILFSDQALAATGRDDAGTLQTRDRLRARVVGLLERAVAEGVFRNDLDLPATAEALVQIDIGLMGALARREPDSPVPPERWGAEAKRLLLSGLLSRKDSTT